VDLSSWVVVDAFGRIEVDLVKKGPGQWGTVE
jgi:hypothetical protein